MATIVIQRLAFSEDQCRQPVVQNARLLDYTIKHPMKCTACC